MNYSIKLLFVVFLPFLSFTQNNGEIKGKILDSLTKEPLYSANVWVGTGNSLIGTTTDLDGRFTLKPLSPGYYDLNVSYIGMKKYFLDNVRVTSGKITILENIYMSGNNTLNVLEVKAERFIYKERLIKPDNTGEMVILPPDLKSSPLNKMPKEMIASLIPGVHQSDDGQPLYFKGSRNDAVQYFVDGVKAREGNLAIPGCAIGEITVYTGGIPARYGDLTGGVVVIETKSFFEIYNQRKNSLH